MRAVAAEQGAAPQGAIAIRRAAIIEGMMCALAVILAAVQTWSARFRGGVDAVSYLDIADAYERGHWKAAVTGVWSPLYSWILALAMRLAGEPPSWEYPLLQAVNFLIFLGSLLAFRFFLRRALPGAGGDRHSAAAAERVLPLAYLVGYTCFIWESVDQLHASLATPDNLVAALTYLCFGLLLGMRGRNLSLTQSLLFGALLGVGYLAKTFLFVLAFVYLFVGTLLVAPTARRKFAVACLAGFLLIAGPFVTALSLEKGRPTFGEAGTFNYAIYVDGASYRHWQGDPPGSGTPKHPTHRVLSDPPTYAFGEPIHATYAPWYDISYWYDGVSARLLPRLLFSNIEQNLLKLGGYFRWVGLLLLGGFVATVLTFRTLGSLRREAPRVLLLLLPPIAACGMFLAVFLESRYVAPFLVVLGVCPVMATLGAPARRSLSWAICAAGMFLAANALITYHTLSENELDARARERDAQNLTWEVASAMHEAGIHEGDRIASIDYAQSYIAVWARLARVRIVAEVYCGLGQGSACFWDQSTERQTRVFDAFANEGATYAISSSAPRNDDRKDWRHVIDVPDASYWIHPLGKPPSP